MNGAPYVRPDVAQFLDSLHAQTRPRARDVAPSIARETFRALMQSADRPPPNLPTVIDLSVPGPSGRVPARLFDARVTSAPGPAMVFSHGGGFVMGDLDSHASACAEIAQVLQIPVIAVDYRLAPEARWPAASEDCEAVARWVANSPTELGRTVDSLVLCGDSAGGTLSIVTSAALRDTPAAVPVIVQALLYPAADLGSDYPSFTEFAEGYFLTRDTMIYFTETYAADLADAGGNPMAGDLAGMPPAVVVTASLDPIRDQGRAYVASLSAAGVPVVYREAVGNIHGFLNLRHAIPSAQSDLLGFLAAVKAVIAEAKA